MAQLEERLSLEAQEDRIRFDNYVKAHHPLRACHARDLVDQLVDIAHFMGVEPTLSKELLDKAAQAYFVDM